MNQSSNPVGAVNVELEEKATQKLAQSLGVEYIDIAKFPINPDVLKLVQLDECRAAGALPFFRNAKRLKVASLDPQKKETQNFVEAFETKGFEVSVLLCSRRGLEHAFEIFDSKFLTKKSIKVRQEFDEKETSTFESQFIHFKDLEERIQRYPTAKALNEIEIFAVQNRASDIHLQPKENGMVVRFRIDGILHDICFIEMEIAKLLVSRIKYEAGMKSNISDIPQDGHLFFTANNRQIDLRVSTLPTEYLESVVMRVLDSKKGIAPFETLGFSESIQKQMQTLIHQKNGMVLVTGPTGSGKTTTLYSMLSEINGSEKKMITLEDPIEYHLDGVTQSQVNERRDYNFSTGLRALLRHDPDVILIGEIRDFSTAKLASEAALTGHLVFSSLHTNSAIGAITRLRNLGLESYNISSAINSVFAQRLLRKTCPHCAKKELLEIDKDEKLKAAIDRVVEVFPDLKSKISTQNIDSNVSKKSIEVLSPQGCEKCSHTGFLGQTVLCENLILNDQLKTMISDGETEVEIKNYVQKNTDFLTLFEDGIRKVLLGESSLSEVYRVAL